MKSMMRKQIKILNKEKNKKIKKGENEKKTNVILVF